MTKETRKKLFQYIGRYRLFLLFSLLLSLASVALTLYLPVLIGNAIDCIADGHVEFAPMLQLLSLAAGLAALTALFTWIMNLCNNYLTYHIVQDVRTDAFLKLQKLPVSYLDSHPSGDILSRIIADADQLSDGLLMGFTQLFTGVVTILGTLMFMLRLNWKIALVVVVFTPLSLFTANFISKRTYAMFKKQSEARADQTALIDEMIGNQKLVRAFSYEPRSQKRFDDINERLAKYSLRAIFYSSITNPATRFINNLIYAGVAFSGAFFVLSGGLTVGGLSCFLSYANQYAKPFNEITGVITELQNAFACAARLFELIEEPSRLPDAPDAKVLEHADGNLRLEHVYFSYTPEKKLIEDFNLTVRAGQRIAIVGPTGCGKTTLINLLMRFYDVTDGQILMEGIPATKITRRSLRKNFGMVLQDTWLSGGTVAENIKMAKSDATDEEMIAAAKSAHAHSFIKRLPQGYETVIGEDGGSLSQGQKQLLCIARLMLALPPILILDEATSSIDTRTEKKVQDAFAKLMQGRTSFIVAHRLSTIQDADVILVMKDGNIIEQGNHETLLAQNGFYKKLFESQFEH